jgi:hypothetical protein
VKLLGKYYLNDVCLNLTYRNYRIAKDISYLIETLGFDLQKRTSPRIEAHVEFKSAIKRFKKPNHLNPIYTSGSISIFSEPGQLYLTDYKSLLEVDLVRKSGCVSIHDSFWDKKFYSKASLLIMLLIMLFWQYNVHELHGAALVKNGKGLLIIGPSGSGKSTIAMSLIKSGWSYLTDDMILLYENGTYVKALPLRRYFKIDQEVVKKYPELSQIAKTPLSVLENKAFLNLHEVYNHQVSNNCIPKIIIFPKISNESQSYLKPMKKSEAFVNLLTNNCYGMFLENKIIKERTNTMNALLSQADSYRLSTGLDLYKEPSMISQILPIF